MQWFARALTREEIRAFLNHVQRGELLSVSGHANYLINLAATNPLFHTNSIRALAEELVRADQLELPFLVLHPGAHLGAGEEAGLKKIADSIEEVFRKIPKVKTKIALEITVRVSVIDSSISRTSSRTCASLSDCAYASTPRICSPRVTRSTANQE
jgi:deoxyribonuclease IV